VEKFPENIFDKTRTNTHPQNKILPIHPKTPTKANFSDVIAIESNQGHLLGVSLKKQPGICVKKSDPQNPAKVQVQIAIKTVLLEK
jgi:hypothetical protein